MTVTVCHIAHDFTVITASWLNELNQLTLYIALLSLYIIFFLLISTSIICIFTKTYIFGAVFSFAVESLFEPLDSKKKFDFSYQTINILKELLFDYEAPL
jgi:hypothetical protein